MAFPKKLRDTIGYPCNSRQVTLLPSDFTLPVLTLVTPMLMDSDGVGQTRGLSKAPE